MSLIKLRSLLSNLRPYFFFPFLSLSKLRVAILLSYRYGPMGLTRNFRTQSHGMSLTIFDLLDVHFITLED